MTMMAEGLKNDFFRDLINCRAYVLPETEVHPYAGWSLMRNTNPLMAFANVAVKSRYFTDYSGGKTGSTGQAGECLTALAKSQDGREFLAVVFNSQIEEGGEAVPYERGQWCLVMLEQVAKALDLPEISSPAKNQNTQADAQASPVKSTEGSTPVPNPPAIDQQKVFSWDFLNKDLYLTPLWLLYALLAVLVLTFLFLLYLLILAKRRKVTILKLRRYINQGPSTHHHLTARRIQDRRR